MKPAGLIGGPHAHIDTFCIIQEKLNIGNSAFCTIYRVWFCADLPKTHKNRTDSGCWKRPCFFHFL